MRSWCNVENPQLMIRKIKNMFVVVLILLFSPSKVIYPKTTKKPRTMERTKTKKRNEKAKQKARHKLFIRPYSTTYIKCF